jgi:quinolinate synthase
MEIAPAAAVAENVADSCSLDNYLAQPDHTMDARIAAAREKLGKDVVLLGHHYQRDEVIRFADYTGDSYKLSKVAAQADAKYMIFCGVHFMAETADVLGRPWQQVILPDLNAGCSMADMAEIGQVEDCWDSLVRAGLTDEAPRSIRVGVCACRKDSVPPRSTPWP